MKKYIILLIFIVKCNFNLSAQTQLEINHTTNLNFKKVDTELNKVYKQLMPLLEENQKTMLIQAEKDWVKYRDSHCKFEASQYEGGSIQSSIFSTCLEELTRKRILEIKKCIKDRNL